MKSTPGPWILRKQDIGDKVSCVVLVEIIGADGSTIVPNEGGLSPNEPWKVKL